MHIETDPAALQREALRRRARGERVGFVPTMGFLHRGHTSLFDLARGRCDWLVASIYVNPLQFGPGEDLDRYPRDPHGDAQQCQQHGVDVLFMPPELYRPDHSTRVRVEGLSDGLCAASRPTHFEGVTTVVARLFGLVQPTIAVFGEKDFQQLALIRRMARDLALPIDIVGGPLVRDPDGLALSSRNAYLTAEQRQRALTLHRALQSIQAGAAAGETRVSALLKLAHGVLKADEIDYLEVRDAASLTPIEHLAGPARAFGAARYGATRLIDNVAVTPDPAG